MKWSDLGKKVAGVGLPSLGGALGGPAGAIVGAEVARRLGLPGANPEAVSAALSDPATIAKLREIEAESEVKLAELEVKDRADARANRGDDKMRIVLALLLVPAPIVVLGLMATGHLSLSTTDQVTVSTILGFLLSEARSATAFFFGSSVGSSRRAAELAEGRKP